MSSINLYGAATGAAAFLATLALVRKRSGQHTDSSENQSVISETEPINNSKLVENQNQEDIDAKITKANGPSSTYFASDPNLKASNGVASDDNTARPKATDDFQNLGDAFKTIRKGLRRQQEEVEDDFDYFASPAPIAGALAQPTELFINNETDATRDITLEELGRGRMIRISKCKNCNFTLPPELGSIVKVFIEICENTVVTIACRIVTRHVEISRCIDFEVRIKTEVDTVQVDLSKDARIMCDSNSVKKIFHAGVEELRVCFEDIDSCIDHDFRFPDQPVILYSLGKASAADQFVTSIVGNVLKTEHVKYAEGGLIPTTGREEDKCLLPPKSKPSATLTE